MIFNISADDWNNTKSTAPGEFAPLHAGGYVCKIVNAEFGNSKAGNDMLILKIDIAEGDYTNNFTNTVARFNQENWPNAATYRQLVFNSDGKLSSFFKGFADIIDKCNPGFNMYRNGGIDTAALVGKMCGFIFCEEEYIKQDKSVGIRVVVRTPKILDDIREGNFKIPPLKKLDADKSPTYQRTNQYSKPPESPDPPSPVGEVIDLEDPPF